MFRKLLRRQSALVVPSKCLSSRGGDGPLKGVKVLDLTRILSGPTCTQALADYGADVYKVENPRTGDETRTWSPFLPDTRMSCIFVAMNRNKKSICVNFKTGEGQDLIRRMARECDVLVENYVPGVLGKYGLDYDSLKSSSPHLIYCSITGFGPEGPYARKAGLDLIASSISGLLDMTGPADGEPCRTGVSVVDIMTGLQAKGAILAALLGRARTGHGCKIDANLLTTALASLNMYGVMYLNAGIEAHRMGTEHGSVVPYKAFKTKNGYFTTGSVGDAQFKRFCQILKITELVDDERFNSSSNRALNRKELYAIVEPKFLEKSSEEWLELFQDSSLAYGPLNSVGQVFNDAHVKAINIVKEVDYPTIGSVKVLDCPVKFSGFVNKLQPAPLLGQHTDEILNTLLQLSKEEISELKSKNVIL